MDISHWTQVCNPIVMSKSSLWLSLCRCCDYFARCCITSRPRQFVGLNDAGYVFIEVDIDMKSNMCNKSLEVDAYDPRFIFPQQVISSIQICLTNVNRTTCSIMIKFIMMLSRNQEKCSLTMQIIFYFIFIGKSLRICYYDNPK